MAGSSRQGVSEGAVATSDEPAIYGAVIVVMRPVLIDYVGKSTYDRALHAISPADAEAYDRTNALGWVPVRSVEAVARACAEIKGEDWRALNDEVSRRGARKTYNTLWRVFMRFSSDEALMTRGPMIFGKTYNRGSVRTEFPEPGRARLLLDWPNAPDLVVRTMRVGAEEMLLAGGREGVRVQIERSQRGATFLCQWEP